MSCWYILCVVAINDLYLICTDCGLGFLIFDIMPLTFLRDFFLCDLGSAMVFHHDCDCENSVNSPPLKPAKNKKTCYKNQGEWGRTASEACGDGGAVAENGGCNEYVTKIMVEGKKQVWWESGARMNVDRWIRSINGDLRLRFVDAVIWMSGKGWGEIKCQPFD